MGTNYYLVSKACSCCGLRDPKKRWHIGKSSGGWCFSLHVDDPSKDWSDPDGRVGVTDLDGWMALFVEPDFEILDEYDALVSVDEMLSTIRDRSWQMKPTPTGYPSWEVFHYQNQSESGPRGLLRHRVDGHHCIAQGAGTWDLVVGEFC